MIASGKRRKKSDRILKLTVDLTKQRLCQIRHDYHNKAWYLDNFFQTIQSADDCPNIMQTESEKRAFLDNQLHCRREVRNRTASAARLMALVENRQRKSFASLATNLKNPIAKSLAVDKTAKKLMIRIGDTIFKPAQLLNKRVKYLFTTKL